MTCLNPYCRRPNSNGFRGLCLACYRIANERVNDGTITWPQLEAAGLANPTEYRLKGNRRPGRKAFAPMSKAIQQLLQQEM